uniref:Mediator of RNA polymerase II transcription subunit 7 n=1 Tax=Caenorhabditis tropicalis TaxID=1561998 RepID=A0A1I7TBL3_9PELO
MIPSMGSFDFFINHLPTYKLSLENNQDFERRLREHWASGGHPEDWDSLPLMLGWQRRYMHASLMCVIQCDYQFDRTYVVQDLGDPIPKNEMDEEEYNRVREKLAPLQPKLQEIHSQITGNLTPEKIEYLKKEIVNFHLEFQKVLPDAKKYLARLTNMMRIVVDDLSFDHGRNRG